jgi:hypothetical protein
MESLVTIDIFERFTRIEAERAELRRDFRKLYGADLV